MTGLNHGVKRATTQINARTAYFVPANSMTGKSPFGVGQRRLPVGREVNAHDLAIDRGDGREQECLKPPELEHRMIDAAIHPGI